MSRRALALSFLLALALMLLATLPLRLGLAAGSGIDPDALGLSADGASGSIWSGRLRSVEWRGQTLGDATLALEPLSLLLGVQRLELATSDLSVDLLRGRRIGIDHIDGPLQLDIDRPLPGLVARLSFENASLVFAGGRCQKAAGALKAELVVPGLAEPIRLQGPVRCDGDAGSIALAAIPAPDAPRVEAVLDIESNGHYRLQSRVQPAGALTGLALQVAGFRDTPAGLVRTDSGQWMD
ncbi:MULTISPECIES: type II secretion system protein N [unclassified Lysobacter]